MRAPKSNFLSPAHAAAGSATTFAAVSAAFGTFIRDSPTPPAAVFSAELPPVTARRVFVPTTS